MGVTRYTGSPMVGRDEELATLVDAVHATAEGASRCLVVEGPAGIGKSRLLDCAAAQAAGLGMTVAAGGATELDHVAPLVALLTCLAGSTPPVIADPAELGDLQSSPYLAIDTVGALLERASAERSLLIVLDDVQWVDELTALALRMLVPSLESSPVMWLFGRRTSGSRSPGQDSVRWLTDAGHRRITLGPLAGDAVRLLATEVLGAAPDLTVLALTDRAGGNPFLLQEALGSLRDDQQIVVHERTATAVGASLPSSFLNLVAQRLAALPPDVRGLLEAGSVLGRRFTVHEVAGLLGTRPVELAVAAEQAIHHDMLVDSGDELAFRHDLIRESVYNNLSGPVRQALHREAAQVTADEGRSPQESAEHLLRSGPRGMRRALETVRGAVVEMAPVAPGTAADMLTRTLALLDEHDPARPGLVVEAVRLLANVGRLAEARGLGEAVLAAGLASDVETTLLRGLAEALKHAGQDAAAVNYTQRGLARTDAPAADRAELHAIQAHALLNTGDLRSASAAADAAAAGARNPPAQVHGMSAQSMVRLASGDIAGALAVAEAAVDVADRCGGEARHRHPRLWLGHALTAADRFTDAAAVYEAGQAESDRLGTAWSQPLWHYYRAELWVAKGLLDDAVAEAEAGLRVAEQLTALALGIPLLGTLAYVAMRRDDLAGADALLQRARRLGTDGIGSRMEDLTWRIALHQFAERQASAAADTVATLVTAFAEGRLLLLVQEPNAAPQLVRILRRVGQRDRAASVAAAADALAAANPEVCSLSATAAHARGLLDEDADALRGAADQYRDGPRPLAVAPLLEDAARAELRRGDREAAVNFFDAALAGYQDCGAAFDTARVQSYLTGLGIQRRARRPPDTDRGAGPAGLAGLTPSELKVARVIAEGKTNREAAAELFLSPHTVDSHLRHIFGKLGISSRVALARWVMENDVAQSRRT